MEDTHLKQLAIDIYEIAKTHSEIAYCLNGTRHVVSTIDYITDTILELFKDHEMIKPFIGNSGIPYDEFIEIPDETDRSLKDYVWILVDNEI